MATNSKQAAKPTKKVISSAKAAVVKKNVAKAPASKSGGKNAVPDKKSVTPVAKKGVPAKKDAPAKKSASPVNIASKNKSKTVNKKNSKPTAVAKKAAPAKKAEPAKKAAPAKKSAPAKKAAAPAPAKQPVAKAPAKPVAKPAPAAKKAAPAPKPAPVAAKPVAKPAAKPVVAKKAIVKKSTLTHLPVKPAVQLPKPMATPVARSTEKKPNIVIAHRRMENKSKGSKDMPEITQYQPEAYRSILDEPQPQVGPVYRYSDEELVEFKEIIASRLEAARKELNYLQGLITRKDEAGTEDTENRYMNMEDGSGAMEREQLAQMASRQIQFMGHLEKALVRIENKTYGICRVTGKLIDKARLRAVPHATLSIEAKKLMSNKSSQ